MRAELIELHRKIGKTMVYVTHDQLEAMTMSSRIAVMRGGVLQQFGTPAEIYDRPANVFVADFIGTPSMTLLDAELHFERRFRRGPDRAARCPVACAAMWPPMGASKIEIKLGVRPEDITLDEQGFPATVKVVEPTGHENIVLLGLRRYGASRHAYRRMSGSAPRERARISFRPSRLHVFDRATGAPLGRRRRSEAARHQEIAAWTETASTGRGPSRP